MTDIMIIIDGMTDRPCTQLNNQTPLEYADCINIRRLGALGATGKFSVKAEGFPVESLPCILTLLGVNAGDIPHGRACLEAYAESLDVGEADLVLRCNLVRIENERLASSCCEDLSANDFTSFAEKTQQLSRQGMQFHHMGSYKNLLIMENAASAVHTLKTCAPHEHIGELFSRLIPNCDVLSKLVEDSIQLLNPNKMEGQPYYALLPWGESVKQELPSFLTLHKGTSASVCATEIVRGLSLAMGMIVPQINGATADTDTDLAAKRDEVIHRVGKNEFILLHINGTDEAAHRRNPKEKAAFLKRIDEIVIGPLMDRIPDGTGVLICSDHSTLSETGAHQGDLQPFYLYRKATQPSDDLGIIDGRNAVSILTNYRGGQHG